MTPLTERSDTHYLQCVLVYPLGVFSDTHYLQCMAYPGKLVYPLGVLSDTHYLQCMAYPGKWNPLEDAVIGRCVNAGLSFSKVLIRSFQPCTQPFRHSLKFACQPRYLMYPQHPELTLHQSGMGSFSEVVFASTMPFWRPAKLQMDD